jgi:hypothetical protein
LGLQSWTLSQAIPGAGGLWDNLTDFFEFHFKNLSIILNDSVKDRERETL